MVFSACWPGLAYKQTQSRIERTRLFQWIDAFFLGLNNRVFRSNNALPERRHVRVN